MLYPELSNLIIDGVVKVHKSLGSGLVESCYHNALFYELKAAGLKVVYNAPFNVEYRGESVGEFFADLAVNGKVIIEIKAVRALGPAHEAQLLNYLHISGCRLGYLVNFQGQKAVWKRFVV